MTVEIPEPDGIDVRALSDEELAERAGVLHHQIECGDSDTDVETFAAYIGEIVRRRGES